MDIAQKFKNFDIINVINFIKNLTNSFYLIFYIKKMQLYKIKWIRQLKEEKENYYICKNLKKFKIINYNL